VLLADLTDAARIVGVSVWDPARAAHAGLQTSQLADHLQREAATALEAARTEFPRLEPRLIRGGEVAGVLGVAASERADLLAVGSHGGSRSSGIGFGSVASAAAHRASCSVLVARRTDGGSFPVGSSMPVTARSTQARQQR